MSNAAKSLDILAVSLNILHIIIIDDLTKLFLDLYLAKFLDTTAESLYNTLASFIHRRDSYCPDTSRSF